MSKPYGRNRISSYVILAIFCMAISCFGEPGDTIPFRHHKLQIDPVSLLLGSLLTTYEYRFTPVHAVALDGRYPFANIGIKVWMAGIQYRHYYSQKNFWGVFANDGKSASSFPSGVRDDTTTYAIEVSYVTIGANWGKVWHLKKRFPIVCRVGAGYPVKNDLVWKNGVKHPRASTLEPIFRLVAALDSELSLGVSF